MNEYGEKDMIAKLDKHRPWLLPTVLILFILEIFTLPLVIEFTYSGRQEAPNHILTYTENKLTWDSATNIREDGSAELDLFNAIYDNAESADGKNIIVPGTEGYNIVRLKNDVSGPVNYTAVLYRIHTSDKIPVSATLDGENFTDTTVYSLPDDVKEAQVVRAVSGTLDGSRIQDFDIQWRWNYYDDDAQDLVDTYLGSKSAFGDADKVTVGLYIVVEDDNNYILPDTPQTGDNLLFGSYIVLMCISGLLLILLFISRRREEKCKS